MTRTSSLALLGALLVLSLAACGKKDDKTAAPADSTNAATTTVQPAPPAPAPTTGIAGAPAVAQQGVNNANAAAQQRASDVDSIAKQAGGTNP